MFVGHGLLAFALAAGVAHALGSSRERALAIGLVAGAFGLAPDVDVLYAPTGLLVSVSPEAFWAAGNAVHRAVTHSLVVGVVAAAAVWLLAGATAHRNRPAVSRRRAGGAVLLLGGVVAVAAAVTGPLAALVTAAFVVAVALVTLGAGKLDRDLGPGAVGAAALVGLLTHPFGDLFTGAPPAMLYPLDAALVTGRVVLHPDPTLHLLGAMGVELATAWLALFVYLRVDGHRLREHLAGRAGLGAGYAALAPVLVPPTLEVSYHFVFSVLAVGLLAAVATRGVRKRPRHLAVTGLAAVTLAVLAYAAVYLGV